MHCWSQKDLKTRSENHGSIRNLKMTDWQNQILSQTQEVLNVKESLKSILNHLQKLIPMSNVIRSLNLMKTGALTRNLRVIHYQNQHQFLILKAFHYLIQVAIQIQIQAVVQNLSQTPFEILYLILSQFQVP